MKRACSALAGVLLSGGFLAASTFSDMQAPPASAPAQSPYSSTFRSCREKAESTLAIVECYGAEAAAWDKRLNASYQALLKRYAAEDQEEPLVSPSAQAGKSRVALLRLAQRAWLAFRDAHCSSESATGGSMSRIAASACHLEAVSERTLLLEAKLKEEPQVDPHVTR